MPFFSAVASRAFCTRKWPTRFRRLSVMNCCAASARSSSNESAVMGRRWFRWSQFKKVETSEIIEWPSRKEDLQDVFPESLIRLIFSITARIRSHALACSYRLSKIMKRGGFDWQLVTPTDATSKENHQSPTNLHVSRYLVGFQLILVGKVGQHSGERGRFRLLKRMGTLYDLLLKRKTGPKCLRFNVFSLEIRRVPFPCGHL